jgi:hypothetical protein
MLPQCSSSRYKIQIFLPASGVQKSRVSGFAAQIYTKAGTGPSPAFSSSAEFFRCPSHVCNIISPWLRVD